MLSAKALSRTLLCIASAAALSACDSNETVVTPDVGFDSSHDTGLDTSQDAGVDAEPGDSGQTDQGGSVCPSGDYPYPADAALQVDSSDDWAESLTVAAFGNPFFAHLDGNFALPTFVKYHISLSEMERPIFQDTNAYRFHYDFAKARLADYQDHTAQDYAAVTLNAEGQELLLGTLLAFHNPNSGLFEIALQFAANETLHPKLIEQAVQSTLDKVTLPDQTQVFYFPTVEQRDCSDELSALLQPLDVTLSDASRWQSGDACYSPGWAVGRAKFVPHDAIEDAFEQGDLLSTDILLTDAVPAEIPQVAGIISQAAATPNSHVALLARTFGVPFARFQNDRDWQEMRALDGRRIALESVINADAFDANCRVRAFEIEGKISDDDYARLLSYKALPEVTFPAKESSASLSMPLNDAVVADASKVGGKAANYGYLLRTAPQNVRTNAIGYTFKAWDRVMELPVDGGGSLREWIDTKLSGFSYPVTNPAELIDALDQVRDAIRDVELPQDLREEIVASLSQFDPNKKIRFRSSTNVEDGGTFSGAGLYSSYSGCLADDTDADDEGPSLCDAERDNERGVFRAVKRTLSSFYNDTAFIERLRFGIDEEQAGMAMLVHHSYYDPDEQANGVITIEQHEFSTVIRIVSQIDDNSVTNPDPGQSPEEVTVTIYDSSPPGAPNRVTPSSLLPIGGGVLETEEYETLADLVLEIQDAFPGGGDLDFEYKKMRGEGLVFKQVRPLPKPAISDDVVAPLVLSQEANFGNEQDEFARLMAVHRLRGNWKIASNSFWATENALAQNQMRLLKLEHPSVGDDALVELADGDAAAATYEYSAQDHMITITIDNISDAGDLQSLTLGMHAPRSYTLDHMPIVESIGHARIPFLADFFPLDVEALYSAPQLNPGSDSTTEERVPYFHSKNPVVSERSYDLDRGDFRAQFTLQTNTVGPFDKTIGALGFLGEVRVEGILDDPIVFDENSALTYAPGHHNFWERFAIEPLRDRDITATQEAELRAKNISIIVIDNALPSQQGYHLDEATIYAIGFDGQVRELTF